VPTPQKILASFAAPLGLTNPRAGPGQTVAKTAHTRFTWAAQQSDPLGVPVVLGAGLLLTVGLLAHQYKRSRRTRPAIPARSLALAGVPATVAEVAVNPSSRLAVHTGPRPALPQPALAPSPKSVETRARILETLRATSPD
jgi:hypothetical protein